MSFTYTTGIPASGNDPSVDQPNMLQNTNSISDIINVDHYNFNQVNGGKHQQINFPAQVSQSAPADPASVVYTTSGTASSVSDLRYRNANAIFPLSCIRAFGTCANSGGGAVVPTNAFNISSCSSSIGTLTVNMPSGIVTGTNYLVICSTKRASSGTSTDQVTVVYQINSATQFTMTTVNVANNVVVNTGAISFVVLQV